MTKNLYTHRRFNLVADASIFFVIFALLIVLRPDVVFPLIYLLLFPYIFFTGRNYLLRYLIIASVCSLVWMLIGGGIYGYQDTYFSIGPISIYPLAAWTVCFFLAYLFAGHFDNDQAAFWKKFLVYSICYLFFVIFYETVAYHVFEIRNPTTIGYPGLPVCDCIHAPVWVQVTYLSMGPVYYLICQFPGIRNRT